MLYNLFFLHGISLFFYLLFDHLKIEHVVLGNLSFNFMRSVICGSIALYSYQNYSKIFDDKCLENDKFKDQLVLFHDRFLHYFIYDLFVMMYQVYVKINKSIRIDLLMHHLLAIFILTYISRNEMYNITLLIGLSEGMSFVSGFKLLSNKLGLKKYSNICIRVRVGYLFFIRMLFLWPSLLYFYYQITNECEKFKKEKNIQLVCFFIGVIVMNEIKWIRSGLKELNRI